WNVWWHLKDTDYLLPKKFITTQWLMMVTFVGLPLIAAAVQLLYGKRHAWRDVLPQIKITLVVGLWLVFMTYAYAKWGRFRQSYLTEFLPQLSLLFGLGSYYVWSLCLQLKPVFLR